MTPTKNVWQLKNIDDRKAELRAGFLGIEDTEERLKVIMATVEANADSLEQEALLSSLLATFFALSHHVKHGGLKPEQKKHLEERAEMILKLKKINLTHRRLNHLAKDFLTLKSQCSRANGEHVKAYWQYAIANRCGNKGTLYEEGVAGLGFGMRLLRLGLVSEALQELNQTSFKNPEDSNQLLVDLVKLKAYRLQNNWSSHAKQIDLLRKKNKSDQVALEVEWEGLCALTMQTGQLRHLVAATERPSASHYQGSYVLESLLWTYAHPQTLEAAKLPILESIARRKQMNVDRKSPLFLFCRNLQFLNDKDIGLENRLQIGYELFEMRRKLPGIDQEILGILALARGLLRSNQKQLARFIVNAYREASFRLTDGNSPDATGLAGEFAELDDAAA